MDLHLSVGSGHQSTSCLQPTAWNPIMSPRDGKGMTHDVKMARFILCLKMSGSMVSDDGRASTAAGRYVNI
jgi:hypothetical protein